SARSTPATAPARAARAATVGRASRFHPRSLSRRLPLMIRSPAAALIILTLINMFNYLDRYVLPAVMPGIKKDLLLSDFQLKLINSSFVIVYMLASPFFGRLGDARSRTGLIGLG